MMHIWLKPTPLCNPNHFLADAKQAARGTAAQRDEATAVFLLPHEGESPSQLAQEPGASSQIDANSTLGPQRHYVDGGETDLAGLPIKPI
jgi:hypothetical protein